MTPTGGAPTGPDGVVFEDQPDWAAARAAVTQLMERYAANHRRR